MRKIVNRIAFKHTASLLLVVFSSVIWGIQVLGYRPLDIYDTTWLWGDLSQVHTAWRQYLSDQTASWLTTNRLSYPLEMSISLFDPMPIFLLISTSIAGFLPENTQYFGTYFLACIVLQGLFGYLAIGEVLKLTLGDEKSNLIASYIIRLCGALLFATTPFTFYRFQGHTALSSQWVLVLSIWLSLWTYKRSWKLWAIASGSTMLLCTGINPYLALMAGLSFTITTFVNENIALQSKLKRILYLSAIALIGLWSFNFIGGASVSGGGYGTYSMNMLGPLDSNNTANLFKADIYDPTGGQTFEGFSYLGLGLIILFALTIILLRQKKAEMKNYLIFSGLLIALVSYLLSLSTKVTLSAETLNIPAPSILTEMLSRFRASGRLFWIGGFWLIIVGITTVAYRMKPKIAASCIAMILAIQIYDVAGVASSVNGSLANFRKLELKPNEIKVEDVAYDSILVFPPWQCDNQNTPGGVRNYELFSAYAAENNLSTNNFYAARTLPEQTNFHCDYEERLSPGNISIKNVYVLSKDLHSRFNASFQKDFDCTIQAEFNDAFVCKGKN